MGFRQIRRQLVSTLAVTIGMCACGGAQPPVSRPAQVASSQSAFPQFAQDPIKGSIVNTTYNTYYDQGRWVSSMGPLNSRHGGLVCDNVDGQRFRNGSAKLWFVAPSDSLAQFGVKYCGSNTNGHEPACQDNWYLCGRKIRIRCNSQSEWCNKPGNSSLLSDMNSGRHPVNNYLPDYYVQETSSWVGKYVTTPRSIVLVISDFCPKDHSDNRRTGNCQSPQFDISTAAFLLLGRMNDQGYINTSLDYTGELLSEYDQSSPGPEW